MSTKREIAENYVRCFCGNDVKGLAALLAPGLRFTGPFYSFNSARDYLESLEHDPPEKCRYEIFSVTENRADYAPAIFKGQTGSVTLTNSVFANNGTDNEFSALSCHESFTDGGGNLQWPTQKNNGNDDTPCAEGILFADPLLGELDDNGGSTPTMMPNAESPANGLGADCPPTDQRGAPREPSCDAGAVEFRE